MPVVEAVTGRARLDHTRLKPSSGCAAIRLGDGLRKLALLLGQRQFGDAIDPERGA